LPSGVGYVPWNIPQFENTMKFEVEFEFEVEVEVEVEMFAIGKSV
jgi:hypothetical protein